MVESMSDDAEYYDLIMGPVEQLMVEMFEHSYPNAKLYVRAFYDAAREGKIYPVPWSDEDIQHEGADLAFAVHYHMTQSGKRRPHSMKFLDWRASCYAALREGRDLPPVPEPDL